MAYPYSTKSPPRLLKLRYINHTAVNTNGCKNPQAAAADSSQPALHSAASIASAVRPRLSWIHSRDGKDLRNTIAGSGSARPASTHQPLPTVVQDCNSRQSIQDLLKGLLQEAVAPSSHSQHRSSASQIQLLSCISLWHPLHDGGDWLDPMPSIKVRELK